MDGMFLKSPLPRTHKLSALYKRFENVYQCMLRFKTGQLVLKSCAIFFESFNRLTTMFLLAFKLGFFLSESIQLVSQFFDGFSRLSASHHFLLVSALRLGGKGNLFCQLFGHLRLGLTKFGKLVRGFIKLRSAIKMISTVII